MNARLKVWLILLAASCLAAVGYSWLTPTFDAPTVWRPILFAVLGILGIVLVVAMPRFRGWKLSVLGIWIPAVLLRVLLLPTAPSDDVNRYLWEGRLVAEGVSPYAQAGDAAALAEYRDVYWEGMNHKDKPTAYPPLTELTFAAVTLVAYHPTAFKLVFVFADLLVLAAVLSLLRRRGLSVAYSGFYAFNPVVLLSFAGEAHFDSLMLAALVWAVWAFEVGHKKWAMVLVSVATGIKWITLPLMPFFLGRLEWRRSVGLSLLSSAVLLLPALFFWDSLPALVSGLLQFGGTRSFNGPVYDLLRLWLDLPRQLCSVIVIGLFSGVVVWRWLQRGDASLDAHCRWVLGALIVLSPTVHFWYVAWMLPFVALRPSLPWLCLSISSGVYFLVWSNDVWGLSVGQRWLFWTPFVVALIYEVWSTRGRVIFPARRDASEPVTISVVIPTLNVAEQLGAALSSIQRQTVRPIEVICVDAGSTDGTQQIAESNELAVGWMQSEQGRGQQIAAGIEGARGSWVCVLHADAVLNARSLERLSRCVATDPTVLGGALGQRFEETATALMPIEVLNDLRALFTRTAFGDQVQFFHRESAVLGGLMPKQPLMEDVESSWRVREMGGFAFLNQPCEVSHRSWKASEWFTRFRLVMRLVSSYRFARLSSRAKAEALSKKLYQEYYKKEK
jgi:hypothetical protein